MGDHFFPILLLLLFLAYYNMIYLNNIRREKCWKNNAKHELNFNHLNVDIKERGIVIQ